MHACIYMAIAIATYIQITKTAACYTISISIISMLLCVVSDFRIYSHNPDKRNQSI